jgi:hypothetical protein
LFKPLALVGKMQLRRGAAFRPIVECWRG